MSVDIKKLFNEQLPAALTKNTEEAKAIGGTFQINVAGEGEWFINASSTGPSIKNGTDTADVTIDIASEDFQTLVADPATAGMKLFFAGKLKLQGNQMLAMKLSKLFTLN